MKNTMTLPTDEIESCIYWAHGFEIVEDAHERALAQLSALKAENERMRTLAKDLSTAYETWGIDGGSGTINELERAVRAIVAISEQETT